MFSEPQASVAPKVKDKEVGSMKKISSENSVIIMVCAAQGYPAPVFR